MGAHKTQRSIAAHHMMVPANMIFDFSCFIQPYGKLLPAIIVSTGCDPAGCRTTGEHDPMATVDVRLTFRLTNLDIRASFFPFSLAVPHFYFSSFLFSSFFFRKGRPRAPQNNLGRQFGTISSEPAILRSIFRIVGKSNVRGLGIPVLDTWNQTSTWDRQFFSLGAWHPAVY